MSTDQELIQEILTGSESAMELLVRKYYKQIFTFLYRKIGNREIVYDLTQEIFIKMMKSIRSYSEEGNFKSWLFTVAINHCRDYWKSADYIVTSKQREIPVDLSSNSNSVSYIFEKKEEREQVKQAVTELPEFQKEAVILKYYHDMKIKEIAQITGANESTVKSRIKQGLQKLQKRLMRGEEDEQKRCQN